MAYRGLGDCSNCQAENVLIVQRTPPWCSACYHWYYAHGGQTRPKEQDTGYPCRILGCPRTYTNNGQSKYKMCPRHAAGARQQAYRQRHPERVRKQDRERNLRKGYQRRWHARRRQSTSARIPA